MQSVVARNDAVGGSCQFDHPRLVLDVRGLIGLRERRACLALREVAIQIAIVRSQHKRGIAFDPEILRRVGMACAGLGANAGKNLDIIPIY